MRKWSILCLLLLLASPAWATQETCPNSWPWVKVEPLSGKTYIYTPPSGYKVTDTCYKAGTQVKYAAISAACNQAVTVTSAYQYDLSHASFKLSQCSTPTPTPTQPPTPTPTPTPTSTPTPTPTPTPTSTPCIEEQEPTCTEATCGQTLTWKNGCVTRYKTCEPCTCEPITECGARCGNVPDGCGGSLFCGTCPPPPPPPGEWPEPICDTCYFPTTMFIENKRSESENIWHAEWFYFMRAESIKQIVIEMYENNEYTIYTGKQEPNAVGNKKILTLTGGRTVTIPWPIAGLPIQQWTHLGFYGGAGRMTIWLENKNHVLIKVDTLKAVVSE